MTKIIVTTILIIFLIGNTFSQENIYNPPNYKKIKKAIKKKKSDLFYENLLNKFQSGDTTFTLKEKRHLYYGFQYQDNYAPYGNNQNSTKLRSILSKDSLSEKEYDEIANICKKSLEKNPFDIRILNYLLFVYDRTQKKELYAKSSYQISLIFDAIMSSGDGRTDKSAFYVIRISDEYDIINIFGLENKSQSLIDGKYDYIELKKNDYNLEGLYFEISPSLNYTSKMLSK